jgi:hypothetical protein
MQIDFDRSEDGDVTAYTIPHKMAFEMLERQICRQFHGSGNFSTYTRAEVVGDQITFYVQVRKNATPTEEQSE